MDRHVFTRSDGGLHPHFAFFRRQDEIEFFHDESVWMILDCMVCLVEDNETDISSQGDIAMSERVKENLWRRHHNLMGGEDFVP